MMRTLLLVAAMGAMGAIAGNAVNPDAYEIPPMPLPREYAADVDSPVPFRTVATPACGAAWLAEHLKAWYGDLAPQVKVAEGAPAATGEEAHEIVADESGVTIRANSLKGVRWAAYTLRQLAIPARGTFRTAGWILPKLKVADRPILGFRCVHLCWIPPITGVQIERAIRLAAMMKFNYCILEPWGMYRSEKNPWWCWPDAQMTKAEVRRLTAIGKDLGITLLPQINVFGHASSARSCSRKHAILDLTPEYEPLFEPGGWNWCLTNPETQRVLRELVSEMIEDFDRPPFFHLGCDEADPPSCPECRKVPYGELVCRHIADLAAFVKARGARAMIWHDMLVRKGDPRWKGFIACGTAETERLVDLLPKDVIICDWQYSYGNMKETRKEWPTMKYFRDKGFPVCGCPWMNYDCMKPMADYLAGIGGFGYVQTTWHHLRGDDWIGMFRRGSAAAWGTSSSPKLPTPAVDFANLLRKVGHDMKVRDPRDTGTINYQVPPAWWVDNM